MNNKKILLGQLANIGDCVLATAVARQIKTDYPGCHLTWAIGSTSRPIIQGNPYVDEIWEIPIKNGREVVSAWIKFEKEAMSRKLRGDFDEVFLTQIRPNNYQNFDGTVRYSIFRGYPKPITVPVSPVICLTNPEVENVRNFAQKYKFINKETVILFECASHSGQSFVTLEFALETSKLLIARKPDAYIILSSNIPFKTSDTCIIDGSALTVRENAELTKYCSLLVGCSSGISWLCTSDWAKPLPMVQLLSKRTSVFASFVHDYEYRKASTNFIIEMTNCSPAYLAECLDEISKNGFVSARAKYHETIPLTFDFYAWTIAILLFKGKFAQAAGSLRVTVHRYGIRYQLIGAVLKNIMIFPVKMIYCRIQENNAYKNKMPV